MQSLVRAVSSVIVCQMVTCHCDELRVDIRGPRQQSTMLRTLPAIVTAALAAAFTARRPTGGST